MPKKLSTHTGKPQDDFDQYGPFNAIEQAGKVLITQERQRYEAESAWQDLEDISYKLLDIIKPILELSIAKNRLGTYSSKGKNVYSQIKIFQELRELVKERRIIEFQKHWFFHQNFFLIGLSDKLGTATKKAVHDIQKAFQTHLPPDYNIFLNDPLFKSYVANEYTAAEKSFIAKTTAKLEKYLKSLKTSRTFGDQGELQLKINTVQTMLNKLTGSDLKTFLAEWPSNSAIIAAHRPKVIFGMKVTLTSIFPFPGKTLVAEINQLKTRFIHEKSSHKLKK